MAWMSGIPHDPQPTHGNVKGPRAAICHRTYGAWGGDYGVATGDRGSIGFHFLVGKQNTQWCQFASTSSICYHAKGANDYSVGIEVTGTNEDPFTAWQIESCAQIVRFLHDTHNLGYHYDTGGGGRHGANGGFMAHNAVSGSDHSDLWTVDDWNRIMDVVGGGHAVEAAPGPVGGRLLRKGDRGEDVAAVQRRLIERGWRLKGGADGAFGPSTDSVIRKFQAEKGLKADGIVGPKTLWALVNAPIT